MIYVENVKSLPSRVIYEVTQICNYDCDGCIARVIKPYLLGPSIDEIIAVGKKCVDEGVPSISWTGGEPYMRKDFLTAVKKIVEYDKDRKVIQTVDTNGSMITKEIARSSAEVFNLARISIYGTPLTFHEEVGLAPSSKYRYNNQLDAVNHFIDSGLKVQINIPVYKIDDLGYILENVNERWKNSKLIEEIVFIPRIKIGTNLADITDYPTEEKIIAFLKNSDVDFKHRIFKWKPGKHIVIKADNKAYAHPIEGKVDGLLFLGDPITDSIESIWKNFPSEFIEAHRKLTPDISHLRRR